MVVAAGQVWWCEGAALAFEAYFKRRPVLILALEDSGEGEQVVVAPLSHRRRFGQEQRVEWGERVSYLTGDWRRVPVEALVSYGGEWAGFAAWRESQQDRGEASASDWLQGVWRWLAGGFERRGGS